MKKLLIIIAVLSVVLAGGIYWYQTRPKSVTQTLSVVHKTTSVVVTPTPDCSVTDVGVITAINKYRSENGVPPLTLDTSLDSYAVQRVISMNGVMDDHVGLKGAADLLGYKTIGEDQNFAPICTNSEARVKGFIPSPEHWDSLMNPNFTRVGIGYFKNVLDIVLG